MSFAEFNKTFDGKPIGTLRFKLSDKSTNLQRRLVELKGAVQHEILKQLEYLLFYAESRREDAGHSGSMHDNGAGDLEMAVALAIKCLDASTGDLPDDGEIFMPVKTRHHSLAGMYQRDNNAEQYAEYMRLKAIFEK
jgi:hypothetical protein